MIRNMRELDLDRIMEIWLTSNIKAHWFIEKAYWENHQDEVRQAISKAAVYVDEENGKIDGFIGLQESWIAGIFVEEEVRSKGIGRALLDHVKALYPELFLRVYVKNEPAVQFYGSQDFVTVKQEADKDTGELEYEIHWEKSRSR